MLVLIVMVLVLVVVMVTAKGRRAKITLMTFSRTHKQTERGKRQTNKTNKRPSIKNQTCSPQKAKQKEERRFVLKQNENLKSTPESGSVCAQLTLRMLLKLVRLRLDLLPVYC